MWGGPPSGSGLADVVMIHEQAGRIEEARPMGSLAFRPAPNLFGHILGQNAVSR